MTPTELNQLPADQQQNTLLAIALGGYTEEEIVRSTGLKENLAYVPRYSYHVLQDWKPAEDKALMWDLVCELGNAPTELMHQIQKGLFVCMYYSNKHNTNIYTDRYNTREQALIAAYIAADLKGLIANWRKDNE